MLAFDSNPVSPHACGASRGCARRTEWAEVAACDSTWHTGEVRAARAL
jgi:hypothetical protein